MTLLTRKSSRSSVMLWVELTHHAQHAYHDRPCFASILSSGYPKIRSSFLSSVRETCMRIESIFDLYLCDLTKRLPEFTAGALTVTMTEAVALLTRAANARNWYLECTQGHQQLQKQPQRLNPSYVQSGVCQACAIRYFSIIIFSTLTGWQISWMILYWMIHRFCFVNP